MKPLLKRIALNGALTAGLLAVLGLGLGELAGFWLAANPGGDRGGPVVSGPSEPVRDSLRYRVPLTMAAWGLIFVVIGESVLFLWRGGVPQPEKKAEPQPDPAEQLLEQILADIEGTSQKTEDRGQKTEDDRKPESNPAAPATLSPDH